jgi:hypothetical protein
MVLERTTFKKPSSLFYKTTTKNEELLPEVNSLSDFNFIDEMIRILQQEGECMSV